MFDVAVVGGGLVGLATARALMRPPASSRRPAVCLIEKEDAVARHQSGRNSGVLHAGIYYAPNSRKAELCRRGRDAMVEYCREHGIAHAITGKVVVAVDGAEIPRLDELEIRARANRVRCERLDPSGLAGIEPHARGVAALHVLDTGIADFVSVANHLSREIEAAGVELRLGMRIDDARESADRVELRSSAAMIEARTIINCAGLFSDRLARKFGVADDLKIVPFRGEYYRLKAPAASLVNGLIYPVPDPRFPFLGVHFTRDIHGEVECGPNAVLAFKREGYRARDFSLHDLADTLSFAGFRRFARRHFAYGLAEWRRSWSRHSFANAARRLLPSLCDDDLEPAPSGVRAQALSADGRLLSDFEIRDSARGLHVLNAPSPAATASLAIGEFIAQRYRDRFDR